MEPTGPRRALCALAAAMAAIFAGPAHGQGASAPDAEAAGSWTALFRDVRFTLGPPRWNGDLTMEYREQRFPGQDAQRAFVLSGNWAASSYVHQPWLAQVSANLGFVATAASAGEGSSGSLTGGGSIVVFPQSRFPFEASIAVNDSRASELSPGADYTSLLASARQSYRMSRDAQVSVRVDHSVFEGATLGRDVLDVAQANFSGRWDAHSVTADGFWSANTGGASRVENRIRRANGQHSYLPSDNLAVDTLATYNWQQVRARASALEAGVAGRFGQLASYATWRPGEEHPLYDPTRPLFVTGALRLTTVGFEAGSASADALALNASGGFTYGVAPATLVSVSGSIAGARTDRGATQLFTGLNANGSYDPPPLRLGRYGLSWRLSGGAASATGGEAARQSAFALASYQLTGDFVPAAASLLTMSFGQGLGTSANTRHESAVSLSNHLQATWTVAGSATSQTYVSALVSDARSWGTPETGFVLANLQLTRQAPVNALSYWSANLTVQGTRQRGEPSSATTTAFDTGLNVSTYGSVSYYHRRAFGVPRLGFSATYTANQSQLQSRAEGNLQAPPRQEGDVLDARFEYRVGRLDMRLVLRSASVDGRRNNGLYLRATRYF